jgi:hypothetical protein
MSCSIDLLYRHDQWTPGANIASRRRHGRIQYRATYHVRSARIPRYKRLRRSGKCSSLRLVDDAAIASAPSLETEIRCVIKARYVDAQMCSPLEADINAAYLQHQKCI